MDARRSDDPLMIAARQLVEHLSNDPVFVKQVADEEIDRRVAAGLLIPTDRLQLAPGLTLAPTGRIESLEEILTAIIDGTEGIRQDLIDQAAGLLDFSGPPAPAAEEATEEEPALPGAPEPEPEPEDEPVPEDEPAPEPAKKPTREDRRRLPDEPGKCEDCQEDLDLEQTRASIIRFRIPLCRPHMANH